jgi:hypothetical protein
LWRFTVPFSLNCASSDQTNFPANASASRIMLSNHSQYSSRRSVPSVEKTLYYTLTLKWTFHLNLFQRYWWVKSVYIFWATLYMLSERRTDIKYLMDIL